MNVCKNEAGNLLPITVTEGVIVNIIPSKRHDFFMSTKEVATGYGTSKYSIFKSLDRHVDDFVEGRHFVRGVDILSTPRVCQPNSIMWTKAGVVRLGFFIKSERAKLFRDWAENLILKIDEQKDLWEVIDMAIKFNEQGYSIEVKTGTNPVEDWMETHDDLLDLLASADRELAGTNNYYHVIDLLRNMMPDYDTALKMISKQ